MKDFTVIILLLLLFVLIGFKAIGLIEVQNCCVCPYEIDSAGRRRVDARVSEPPPAKARYSFPSSVDSR